MSSVLKIAMQAQDIPVQEASSDIWDKKYRLKAKDGRVIDRVLGKAIGPCPVSTRSDFKTSIDCRASGTT